jgi:hypothetical protein
MLPWHVRFTLQGVSVESVDSVRFHAVLSFARAVATPERGWPQLERLAQAGQEIDAEGLIAELDALARLDSPRGVRQVVGNIRDDVYKAVAIASGRG